MHGRHSMFLDLVEYNPEIERSLSRIRAKKRESKKKMVEEQNSTKQLKEYFTPATYDSPTRTLCPPLRGNLNLSIPLFKCSRHFMG